MLLVNYEMAIACPECVTEVGNSNKQPIIDLIRERAGRPEHMPFTVPGPSLLSRIRNYWRRRARAEETATTVETVANNPLNVDRGAGVMPLSTRIIEPVMSEVNPLWGHAGEQRAQKLTGGQLIWLMRSLSLNRKRSLMNQ